MGVSSGRERGVLVHLVTTCWREGGEEGRTGVLPGQRWLACILTNILVLELQVLAQFTQLA